MNKSAAINILNGHDLYILSIEQKATSGFFHSFSYFFNRVRNQDLMVFTRQFATMLEASIPLSDALKSLYRETRNESLKEAIYEILTDIDSGLSLSQALEKHSEIFSEFYINLIRSAEITGEIETALTFLAGYLEKESILLSKVRNALIYPVFVLVLFVIVSGVLLGVVFPQLEPIFAESKVPLPWISQIFLNLGTFIANWYIAIIISAIILFFILFDYFRSKEGRVVLDEIILSTPVFGRLLRQAYVARFAEATSVLIKGGVPIAQAIEIGAHTIGSAIYRDALYSVSDAVRSGEPLSDALYREESLFPPLVSQMVAVGESTGRLDEMLSKVYDFFSREINSLVDSLVELIQPALILFIGALVGLLFASILLPIYNLVQVF